MLDVLNARVGLRPGQTVVVDRGMAFDDNLESVRRRGLHYIVASRQKERDRFLAEICDPGGFEEVVREPKSGKSHVFVKKVAGDGGQNIILCRSEERVQKDRAIREKAEAAFVKSVKALESRVAKGLLKEPEKVGEAIGRLRERYPRAAKYYSIELKDGKLEWGRDEAALATAAELDGSYILKTDRADLSAEDAWRTYMLLTRVENAFRDLKSPLALRPVFHRLEARVHAHVFLCVLAYHILNAIELTLRRSGDHASWETIRAELSTHQAVTIVLPTADGREIRIRKACSPTTRQRDIYRRLGISQHPVTTRISTTPRQK
jgi:transposase